MSTDNAKDYIDVIATVHTPDGTTYPVPSGSYPVWALPLDAAWKKSRRAVAYDVIGHYPTRGDGWRVTFTLGESY